MRELRNPFTPIALKMKLGRAAWPAWPVGGTDSHKQKGGARPHSHFIPLSRISVLKKKKEMKTSKTQTPADSHTVSPYIKAAELVRERGQLRPIGDTPMPEEEIGILFNIVRRRNKVTLEDLALKSGHKVEELMAFEAGFLPRLRMCEMLPGLARNVGIDTEELLQEIRQKKTVTFNN
jgi:hypothetical protein